MQKVSVIIPTHNRSERMIRAVDSVRRQTYKNLEIVIVNDASIDDTEEIASKIDDDRIIYLRIEKSQGANHARNFGVSHSSGAYLAFLDDDDEWFDEKIDKQLKVFEEYPEVGLVYTQRKIINDENQYYYSNKKDVGDLSHKIIMENPIGTTSSVMLKRDIFEKVGGFDPQILINQDHDLWIRVAQVTQVGIVDEPLVLYYDLHKINRISNDFERMKSTSLIFQKKYKDLLKQLTPKEIRKRKSNKFMRYSILEVSNKHFLRALFYNLRAILIAPSSLKVFSLLTIFLSPKMKQKLKFFIKRQMN